MKKLISISILVLTLAVSASAQDKLKGKAKRAADKQAILDRNPLIVSSSDEIAVSQSKLTLTLSVQCHDLDTEPGEEHVVCFDQNLSEAVEKETGAMVLKLREISRTEINKDGFKRVTVEAIIAR